VSVESEGRKVVRDEMGHDMSDPDLRESVGALGATVKRLGDVVEAQGVSASTLAEQVIESNVRAARDAKVLRILVGFMVFKVIMLLLLFVAIQRVNDTNDAIKDCTTPAGQCAKRGAATTAVFLNSAALRGERERLTTEIPATEAKGDTVRLEQLQKRFAELNEEIAQADQQLADIRNQKTRF
jgi:hypothetical protein